MKTNEKCINAAPVKKMEGYAQFGYNNPSRYLVIQSIYNIINILLLRGTHGMTARHFEDRQWDRFIHSRSKQSGLLYFINNEEMSYFNI